MPTQQEKIDQQTKINKIYKVIAEPRYFEVQNLQNWETITVLEQSIYIWDVLDWNEKVEMTYIRYENWVIEYVESAILCERKDKRKPIEHQSDECIDFIYWLIEDEN